MVDSVNAGEISIPKDRFLKEVVYDAGTTSLVFTFVAENGDSVVRVNIGDLVDVYTAGNGLQLEGGTQYPTDFTDTNIWEDQGAVVSSTKLSLSTWTMGGDTGISNNIKAKVATPTMKVKFITDGNGYLDYMYSGYNTLELPRSVGEHEVELPASTVENGWGARFSGSGNGNFTIELIGTPQPNKFNVVIDPTSDSYLTVGPNGVKLTGVAAAINSVRSEFEESN